jgi:hypothetical protein
MDHGITSPRRGDDGLLAQRLGLKVFNCTGQGNCMVPLEHSVPTWCRGREIFDSPNIKLSNDIIYMNILYLKQSRDMVPLEQCCDLLGREYVML